jgi:hypothetical protein
MSKLIDYLISDARESTENEEYDDVIGLSEEEIVKFINQGLNRLHSKIVAQHPQVFVETYETSIVANQEAYSIPSHKAYLKNKVSQVDYRSSSTYDYHPLDPTVLRNRSTIDSSNGYPCKYIRRGGEILLIPIPSTSQGNLRLTYVPKAKQLDKRRGIITAVTTLSSAITNLEIDYINGTSVDNAALRKNTRFSVVDKYGNIKMENILLSQITASGTYDSTLEVDASFTYESTESIAIGDYVIPGAYSTSHFDLGPEVERYLQLYTEVKILKRDSSGDSQEAFQELALIENDIIESYADISDDIMNIPDIGEDDWGIF